MKGKTINNYTLLNLIGRGGMAEVWYAENRIHKASAVKLLLPKYCSDPDIVNRFKMEAEVMVRLSHPNIRQVYDYVVSEERPCILMEYLDGADLSTRMKRGERFSEFQLRKWWNQLVDALNYTHRQGIIHRDIKPSNIFVTNDDNVKLMDFGIAKVRDSFLSTHTGATMGTLMYMSPEQVRDSKHIDAKTDIYSLAVTFVHLFLGKAPYNYDTTDDFELRNSIVTQPLDLGALPRKWQYFLRPYLAKKPEERPPLVPFTADVDSTYDSERTYFEDLPQKPIPTEQTIAESSGGGIPYSSMQRNAPPPKKHHVWPFLLVFLLLVVGGGVIYWLSQSQYETVSEEIFPNEEKLKSIINHFCIYTDQNDTEGMVSLFASHIDTYYSKHDYDLEDVRQSFEAYDRTFQTTAKRSNPRWETFRIVDQDANSVKIVIDVDFTINRKNKKKNNYFLLEKHITFNRDYKITSIYDDQRDVKRVDFETGEVIQ